MRFLFGIFIGAALTMLVATATDAPTSPILDKVTGLWDQLIENTSNRLFQPPTQEPSATYREPSATYKEPSATYREPSATYEEPSATYEEPSAAYKEPSADKEPSAAYKEPSPTLTTPEDPLVTVQPDLPVTPASPETVAETSSAASADAVESAMTPLLPSENTDLVVGDDAMLSLENVARVWVPFRSERSANGFADTLSRHFAHPFSVHRDGPGVYQVTFNYVDTEQRESMLLDIAELTGR